MFCQNGPPLKFAPNPHAIATATAILSHPIEYLKGVGPLRADLLKKELGIFTYNDLLHHFPYRHLDRTRLHSIIDLTPATEFAQVKGRLISVEQIGEKSSRRIVAQIKDDTGAMELTWFKGLNWVQKTLQEGRAYLAFGRLTFFMGRPQMVHPELEALQEETTNLKPHLEPVYSTTEKLCRKRCLKRR